MLSLEMAQEINKGKAAAAVKARGLLLGAIEQSPLKEKVTYHGPVHAGDLLEFIDAVIPQTPLFKDGKGILVLARIAAYLHDVGYYLPAPAGGFSSAGHEDRSKEFVRQNREGLGLSEAECAAVCLMIELTRFKLGQGFVADIRQINQALAELRQGAPGEAARRFLQEQMPGLSMDTQHQQLAHDALLAAKLLAIADIYGHGEQYVQHIPGLWLEFKLNGSAEQTMLEQLANSAAFLTAGNGGSAGAYRTETLLGEPNGVDDLRKFIPERIREKRERHIQLFTAFRDNLQALRQPGAKEADKQRAAQELRRLIAECNFAPQVAAQLQAEIDIPALQQLMAEVRQNLIDKPFFEGRPVDMQMCRGIAVELAKRLNAQGINAQVYVTNEALWHLGGISVVHFWVETEDYILDAFPEGVGPDYGKYLSPYIIEGGIAVIPKQERDKIPFYKNALPAAETIWKYALGAPARIGLSADIPAKEPPGAPDSATGAAGSGPAWHSRPVRLSLAREAIADNHKKIAAMAEEITAGLMEWRRQWLISNIRAIDVDDYTKALQGCEQLMLETGLDAAAFEEILFAFHAQMFRSTAPGLSGKYHTAEGKQKVSAVINEVFSDEGGRRIKEGALAYAVEVFLRVLKAQAFHNGNHRAADFVMNFILVKSGQGYFLLTPENAKEYYHLLEALRGKELSSAPEEVNKITEFFRRELHKNGVNGGNGVTLTPPANPAPASSGEVGGINFTHLPAAIQPAPQAPALTQRLAVSSTRLTQGLVSLQEERREIERMLSGGIIPSSQRIKEYLFAACNSQGCQEQFAKILACIADILRLEEERCADTEGALRQMLILLESGKPAQELQLALAQVKIEAGEPKVVEE
jgi:prophage maintenance system killer protein